MCPVHALYLDRRLGPLLGQSGLPLRHLQVDVGIGIGSSQSTDRNGCGFDGSGRIAATALHGWVDRTPLAN